MNKEEETFSRGRLLLDLPNGEGKKIIYWYPKDNRNLRYIQLTSLNPIFGYGRSALQQAWENHKNRILEKYNCEKSRAFVSLGEKRLVCVRANLIPFLITIKGKTKCPDQGVFKRLMEIIGFDPEDIPGLPISGVRDEVSWADFMKKALCDIVKLESNKIVSSYKIDLAIPSYKLALEFQEQYHNHPKQQKKDIHRQRYLQSHGWTVINFQKSDPPERWINILLNKLLRKGIIRLV